MKYTEKYCTDLLQKVINDLDEWRGYESFYDKATPFKALYKENEENFYDKSIVEHSWLVYAKVPKDGWKGGNIIIHVDDTTERQSLILTALGGRPITLPLKIDENGTYYIPREALPYKGNDEV